MRSAHICFNEPMHHIKPTTANSLAIAYLPWCFFLHNFKEFITFAAFIRSGHPVVKLFPAGINSFSFGIALIFFTALGFALLHRKYAAPQIISGCCAGVFRNVVPECASFPRSAGDLLSALYSRAWHIFAGDSSFNWTYFKPFQKRMRFSSQVFLYDLRARGFNWSYSGGIIQLFWNVGFFSHINSSLYSQ